MSDVPSKEILAERLRIALDLFETGVALQRAAFRREHPELSDDQIELLVNKWLATRPGAEKGDGPQD